MKTFDYAQFIELTRSHEQRNLEYKDSFSWDKSISDIQARTIRAIISMANIPDGGKVISGIKEKNSNIEYTGLTQIQKDTFKDIDKTLQKDIQQILESIDRANNHRMMLGAESWNEYKGYIESVITVSNNIIEYFKSKNLNLSNIDEETKKQLKYIFNWLKKFDDFKYKEYLYTSSSFAEIVYQLGYYYSFIDNNISSTLLNMGDTFTKHSMGLTNTDYVTVKKEIPEMVKEINKLLTK